jgi:hypothetical protein
MIRQRLASAEKAIRVRSRRPCPLCFGHPVCVEDHDNTTLPAKAFRDRVTDDFRCSRCGIPAVVIRFPHVGWPSLSANSGDVERIPGS